MKADDYNRKQFESGFITYDHIASLWSSSFASQSFTDAVSIYQREANLFVDGKFGPKTRAHLETAGADPMPDAIKSALRNAPLKLVDGWLVGKDVVLHKADPTWYGDPFPKTQRYVIWHYTATGANTAANMAKRRVQSYPAYVRKETNAGGKPRGKTSWHLTIDKKGRIFQSVPLTHRAFHAGGPNRRSLPTGGHPNRHSLGLELEGRGESFPVAQVAAAARVLSVCADVLGVTRAFNIGHREVHRTKRDPGELWMGTLLPAILDEVYK